MNASNVGTCGIVLGVIMQKPKVSVQTVEQMMSQVTQNEDGSYTVPLLCEVLIDQDRLIGDDPVGYRCTSAAEWETPDGYLICDNCRELHRQQPSRVTFPVAYGIEHQKWLLQQLVRYVENNTK